MVENILFVLKVDGIDVHAVGSAIAAELLHDLLMSRAARSDASACDDVVFGVRRLRGDHGRRAVDVEQMLRQFGSVVDALIEQAEHDVRFETEHRDNFELSRPVAALFVTLAEEVAAALFVELLVTSRRLEFFIEGIVVDDCQFAPDDVVETDLIALVGVKAEPHQHLDAHAVVGVDDQHDLVRRRRELGACDHVVLRQDELFAADHLIPSDRRGLLPSEDDVPDDVRHIFFDVDLLIDGVAVRVDRRSDDGGLHRVAVRNAARPALIFDLIDIVDIVLTEAVVDDDVLHHIGRIEAVDKVVVRVLFVAGVAGHTRNDGHRGVGVDRTARDLYRIAGQHRRLKVGDIAREAVGDRQHQRHAYDAYTACDRGHDRPSLFGHKVAEGQLDRGQEAHARALEPLLFLLDGQLLLALGRGKRL